MLLTREVDSSGLPCAHCLLSAWKTDVMLEEEQPCCEHRQTSNAGDGCLGRQEGPGSQEVNKPVLHCVLLDFLVAKEN